MEAKLLKQEIKCSVKIAARRSDTICAQFERQWKIREGHLMQITYLIRLVITDYTEHKQKIVLIKKITGRAFAKILKKTN